MKLFAGKGKQFRLLQIPGDANVNFKSLYCFLQDTPIRTRLGNYCNGGTTLKEFSNGVPVYLVVRNKISRNSSKHLGISMYFLLCVFVRLYTFADTYSKTHDE